MWDGQPLPLPASHLFARAYVRGVRGGPFCPVLKKREKSWIPFGSRNFFRVGQFVGSQLANSIDAFPVTKQDIEEHFSSHGSGKIMEIKLMSGFGFIEYEDGMDARDVVPGKLLRYQILSDMT